MSYITRVQITPLACYIQTRILYYYRHLVFSSVSICQSILKPRGTLTSTRPHVNPKFYSKLWDYSKKTLMNAFIQENQSIHSQQKQWKGTICKLNRENDARIECNLQQFLGYSYWEAQLKDLSDSSLAYTTMRNQVLCL